MTLEDANYLLGVAAANYSYAFRNMTQEQKQTLVRTWAFGLQDIPADIVMLAFMQLTTTSEWLPTVAKIRQQTEALCWEAKNKLDDDENMRRLAEIVGQTPGEIRDKRGDALRRYIVEKTEHLCSRRGPGLSLDTILNAPGGYTTALGSGRMGFDEIQQGGYVMLGEETGR